jgi:RNA polymerase sigma factor (TIGR02999 family)
MSSSGHNVTTLLRRLAKGDRAAVDLLLPIVYEELHRLAAKHLHWERAGHTLQPTALVSEAYLRLVGAQVSWQDRAHFISVAASTMRRILVDYARIRNAAKRGDGERPLSLEETVPASAPTLELVSLAEALDALSTLDERKARVVELTHFGGLTQEEIAHVLGVGVSTVARDLRFAEAWLRDRLQPSP